jgi:hypothetical protein
VAEGREQAVTEMLTCLFVGRLPRGWSFLGQITAVSWMVTADVWRQGWHYRQRATWSGIFGPLEVLEPTQRHGTRLVVRLDDDYFPPAAGLATDPAGLLASLLDDPGPFCSEPGFACGTRLEVLDDRTSARVLHVNEDRVLASMSLRASVPHVAPPATARDHWPWCRGWLA